MSYGKIARLPWAIREQLNERLADTVPGAELAAWLNSLPEVKKLVAELFEGRAVTEQNISEWRQGGYEEWLVRKETFGFVQDTAEHGQSLRIATRQGVNGATHCAGGQEPPLASLADALAMGLAVRFARLMDAWEGRTDEEFMKKLEILQTAGLGIARMRRCDLAAERFNKVVMASKSKVVEACLQECKQWPEVEDAFRKAFQLLKDKNPDGWDR